MARRFDVNKLPKDVLNKIDTVNFVGTGEMADENVLGEVWLKDGWVFDGTSHYATFYSRQSLIDDIRNNAEIE